MTNRRVFWPEFTLLKFPDMFLVISVMLPFHSEADVDQKLLFSMAHAADGGSLSVTVTAAITTIVCLLLNDWIVHVLLSLTLILTFLCPCHCSDGSDRLHVGNQSHCTPSKVSIRGQENQWDDERDFNYLRCGGGCGEALTFPDPAQSLQGFLPIPTQMWQACVKHVPHQQ